MLTRESQQFFARQQHFVFIHPESEIDAETNLPKDSSHIIVVDADDLACAGFPMNDEEVEYEFWAVLEPGETLPNEVQ
jgi:hypothetical protein